MASIGGSSVTVFQGRMYAASRRTRLDDGAVGVDGSLIVRSSWKTEPCKIHTEVEVGTSLATARTLIDAYRGMMSGTGLITVVDSMGETWSNVTVLSVTAEPHVTIVANTWRVTADWVLLPAAVPA